MPKWNIVVEESTRYLIKVEADSEEDAIAAYESDNYCSRKEIKFYSDWIAVEREVEDE